MRRVDALYAALAAAVALLDLGDDVRETLLLQPTRGALAAPVPTAPTIYRFYEVLQVYGPTIRNSSTSSSATAS
jgi:cyanate lyase